VAQFDGTSLTGCRPDRASASWRAEILQEAQMPNLSPKGLVQSSSLAHHTRSSIQFFLITCSNCATIARSSGCCIPTNEPSSFSLVSEHLIQYILRDVSILLYINKRMWRERVKYLFLVLCLVRDVSTERGKDVSERGLPRCSNVRYPLFALFSPSTIRSN